MKVSFGCKKNWRTVPKSDRRTFARQANTLATELTVRKLVGVQGLEPWTPCSQSWCASQTAPYAEKNGGGDRHRTCDSLLAKQVLCQLSYTPENQNTGGLNWSRTSWYPEGERGYSPPQSPMLLSIQNLVPLERFELPAHGFEGRRSVQLS